MNLHADILLKHAWVVDGSGTPGFAGDVAVRDGVIIAIGSLEHCAAREVVDCAGRMVCPGFIDMHGHSELQLLRDPAMGGKIGQGITTEVAGNCGIGVYPVPEDELRRATLVDLTRDVLGDLGSSWPWQDFAGYTRQLQGEGHGTNVVFLQSHAALRCSAMEGSPNREATPAEIALMVSLLHQSYEQGCFGFSSGLYYAPCMFASHDELVALLEETARWNRVFAVHHRCEGDDVIESLHEVLELAQATGVRLEVSHLKAIGRANQQHVPTMLRMIEQAREDGVDVLFDQYPYTYGSTSLFSLLPPSYLRMERDDLRRILQVPHERMLMRGMMEHPQGWDSIYELCGWEDISIVSLDHTHAYDGLSIAQIAASQEADPFDVFFDLLSQEPGCALMADITQSEESLRQILVHPLGCFGTDALYSGGAYHPRSFAAAVHVLSEYCRKEPLLAWETMIRKMTGEVAQRLGLHDRGQLQQGMCADIVVFDPNTICDTATLANPRSPSSGLELVLVNGKVAYRDGRCTGSLDGKVLCP